LVDDLVVDGGEFGRRGGTGSRVRCHDDRDKAIFGNEGEFVEKDGSNKAGDGARNSRRSLLFIVVVSTCRFVMI
jgi:hypothetical protein